MSYFDPKERGQLQPACTEDMGGKGFCPRFLVCLTKTSLLYGCSIIQICKISNLFAILRLQW
jgi:hypothetical protein